jgi:hypothetical protein
VRRQSGVDALDKSEIQRQLLILLALPLERPVLFDPPDVATTLDVSRDKWMAQNRNDALKILSDHP